MFKLSSCIIIFSLVFLVGCNNIPSKGSLRENLDTVKTVALANSVENCDLMGMWKCHDSKPGAVYKSLTFSKRSLIEPGISIGPTQMEFISNEDVRYHYKLDGEIDGWIKSSCQYHRGDKLYFDCKYDKKYFVSEPEQYEMSFHVIRCDSKILILSDASLSMIDVFVKEGTREIYLDSLPDDYIFTNLKSYLEGRGIKAIWED